MTQGVTAVFLGLMMAFNAYAQPNAKVDFTQGEYTIERLSDAINSPTAEIYPRISDDGRMLYFTRQGHPANSKVEPTGIDLSAYSFPMPASESNQDIWEAELNSDGGVIRILHPGFPLNSTTANTIHCVLPGRNIIVVQNQIIDNVGNNVDFAFCTLFGNGLFGNPREIKIDGYKPIPGFRKVHFYTNGTTGILSINLGDGQGANDLYVTTLKSDGTWSRPQNMGTSINTEAMEMSPYLATDLRTLYFASGASGKEAIYVARRTGDDWTHWTKPERLPAPINSNAVDRDPCIDPSGRYLYFSSNRGGNFDIYRVKLAQQVKPQTVALVRLHTVRATDKTPLGGEILVRVQKSDFDEITPAEAGLKNVPASVSTNTQTGIVELRLPVGYTYTFSASRPLHLSATGLLNLTSQRDYSEFDISLPLTPVSKGTKTNFSNILFKVGTAQLVESSFTELERLATTMKEDNQLRITVEGHTDNIGAAAELQALSQKRAQAIKDYLVKQGVATDRIDAKGYGGTRPAFDNKLPEQREKNRRVEIVVR